MNKLLKGSIAGAAGIALLLGGAGTLAYWNDSTALAAGEIQSGELRIATSGSAAVKHRDSGDDVEKIIPGDTVVITQGVTITATGDNLRASLSATVPSSLAPLLNYRGVNLALAAFDADGNRVGGSGDTSLVINNLPAADAKRITSVQLTGTFPADSVSGTDGQAMAINLDTLRLALTQVG